MPETLKKLREPAALAAAAFAGVVVLVGIINLLAPPGNGASAVPFSDRAYDQATVFLSLDVAAAVAFAVYLANHAGPAVEKARLITLAALIEVGLAALFGVVSALAQFGASGVDGESKFLRFLESAGGAAVVAVAGLFTWLTWQALAPAPGTAPGRPAGAFVGGNWPSNPSGTGAGGSGASGQQFGQPTPPPGGFGWTPQQGSQQQSPGQSSPTAFGQQVGQPGQAGQVPGQNQGQSAGYGQPSPQGAPGAPQPFGADRTQMLPPVQSGQAGQPGQPQPGAAPGQSPFGQPPQPGDFGQPSPYGQSTPSDQYGQPSQSDQYGQSGYGQGHQPPQAQPQPPQLGQQIGQATLVPGTPVPGAPASGGYSDSGVSGSSSHQVQPPLPPTMQSYAAEPSPWSPGGPGAGGAAAGQHDSGQYQQHDGGQYAQQQGQPQPGQQVPQPKPEDADQRPGPFQIGDWRSE